MKPYATATARSAKPASSALAARYVSFGASWAFLEHRSLAEIWRAEIDEETAQCLQNIASAETMGGGARPTSATSSML